MWLFDLDDTLHDASFAIFDAIDRRMTDYVERALGVERAEANRLRLLYWRRYGATLLGLVRHHGVDAGHFLRETHDFSVAGLLRAYDADFPTDAVIRAMHRCLQSFTASAASAFPEVNWTEKQWEEAGF